MVDELRDLLHANVADAPPEPSGVTDVVRLGRRRVARRRTLAAGGVAAAVALVVTATSVGPGLLHRDRDPGPADVPDDVNGPVLTLGQADQTVPNPAVHEVYDHTNRNLDVANGQYVDGMTADGLVVLKDGPFDETNIAHLSLIDPGSGAEDRLPDPPVPVDTPLALDRDRLVYGSMGEQGPAAAVFDRSDRAWSVVTWSGVPQTGGGGRVALGPDGRVYLTVDGRQGPGTPVGPPSDSPARGEIDDSGAVGESYALWSASLADPADVRDEHLRVGDFAFDGETLVWTRTTNGVNDQVSVRDLATGDTHSFDPQSGRHCNQLGLGVTDDVVVLSQYCGDYPEGRDDRAQLLTTDGRPVVTIRGDGLEAGVAGAGLVQVTVVFGETGGDYVYDVATGHLRRLSAAASNFSMGGPVPRGYVLWDEPANHRHGSHQVLARVASNR